MSFTAAAVAVAGPLLLSRSYPCRALLFLLLLLLAEERPCAEAGKGGGGERRGAKLSPADRVKTEGGNGGRKKGGETDGSICEVACSRARTLAWKWDVILTLTAEVRAECNF